MTSNHKRIKLTDFGLSKAAGPDASKIPSIKSGDVAGTLLWMAPEVLNGEHHQAKPADVYSYAMVLVELVTGDIPWPELKENNLGIYGRIYDKEVRYYMLFTNVLYLSKYYCN